MSFSIHATQHSSSRSRKFIIAFLVILTLFLVGTVVVLSSVSYYLAIPAAAYLSETEVAWTSDDAIKPLKYSPEGTAKSHRRQLDADVFDLEVEAEEIGAAENASTTEWDVDGPGSGQYWMRKDWDGHVDGTHDWSRLNNVTTKPGESIPRLIHQTWKDDHLPLKWRKAWKECREGMQDYEYMLWTDETSREFIKTHYPHHLHMFDSYTYPIQRADSIRYFVLHHFGGIYMDLDIGCRRRMDNLLKGDWDALLPITKPVGVSNDLVFSSKGSPFMDHTIHALPAWDHTWFLNYPTVMFSTGPMFLSAQYAIYSSAHPTTDSQPNAEVRILPTSLYGKNVPAASVPHSFFAHFYGSSWHADDAGFVTFLGVWGKGLMYVGAAVIILGIARLVYMKMTGTSKEYHLLSILPTHSGATTPTSEHPSVPFSPPTLEAFQPNQLPSDIANAFRRAGNLILAAPATLLSGDRDKRNDRRKQGLLYFVPALFQPSPPTRRGRTASEASQMPLRRTRRDRERERERERSRGGHNAPPPYEDVAAGRRLISSPKPVDRKNGALSVTSERSERSDADDSDGYRGEEGSSASEFEVAEWEWKETR